jgi:hypothetical protein
MDLAPMGRFPKERKSVKQKGWVVAVHNFWFCCTQRWPPSSFWAAKPAATATCAAQPFTISWVSPRSALPSTCATNLESILPWKVTKAPAAGQVHSSSGSSSGRCQGQWDAAGAACSCLHSLYTAGKSAARSGRHPHPHRPTIEHIAAAGVHSIDVGQTCRSDAARCRQRPQSGLCSPAAHTMPLTGRSCCCKQYQARMQVPALLLPLLLLLLLLLPSDHSWAPQKWSSCCRRRPAESGWGGV